MKRYKRTGRQPKEQVQKKKRLSTKMWLSIGIAVIMATSIIGFLAGNQSTPAPNQFEYNNHTITGSPQAWQVDIDGATAAFQFLPSDVDDIPYPSDIPGLLRNALAFSMTSAPEDNLSLAIGAVEYALYTRIGGQGRIVLYAFTQDNAFGKPILTCENATAFQPVILFEQGNETMIARQGSCIIATAPTEYHMRRLGERVLYTHYRIIPDDYAIDEGTVLVSS